MNINKTILANLRLRQRSKKQAQLLDCALLAWGKWRKMDEEDGDPPHPLTLLERVKNVKFLKDL